MKINTATAQVQSTMSGENVTMAIRPEDMAHIMGVLDGLYTNRLRAVIREYSTNAWDAHIEAGFSGPIEVTLPTSLHPYLTIRDYGEGLDRDGITEVYSQYGRSTKRDSDAVTGMLGLGSKSALAYNSHQFTVHSIKNGRKIAVLVAKDEHGMGVMSILGDPAGMPTDEASGTLITIAVSRDDIRRAGDEAADFYAYWTPGSVTVNGKEPRHFTEGALRLTDELFMVTSNAGAAGDRIVMGNVAYPQPLDVGVNRSGYGRLDFSLVAIVPIGAVMPTPSREALKDVKLTKDTIASVEALYSSAVHGSVQREIDKCETPQDAIRIADEWAKYMPGSAGVSDFTYKGHTIPAQYSPAHTLPGDMYNRVEVKRLNDGYAKKGTTHKSQSYPSTSWPRTLWLQNFEPEKFTAQHYAKIQKYIADNGVEDVSHVVLCRDSGPVGDFFIDAARFIPWTTIKAVKLPKATPGTSLFGSTHIAGSYKAYTESGYNGMTPGDTLRVNKPIFYIQGNQHEGRYYSEALKHLMAGQEWTLVCLQQNRVEKFRRDVPTVQHVKAAVQGLFDKWLLTVPKDERKAMGMSDAHLKGTLEMLDPAKVDDPAVKEGIRIANIDVMSRLSQRNAFRSIIDVTNVGVRVPNPLANYPLFSSSKLEHSYIYMNAAYAARKAGTIK